MGGVNLAGQLRFYYDTQLTWWLMLRHDDHHAYIILAPSHKEFHLHYAWGLILVSTGPTSLPVYKAKIRRFKEDTSLLLGRSCDCGHFPVRLGRGKRLGCWLCYWKGRENL